MCLILIIYWLFLSVSWVLFEFKDLGFVKFCIFSFGYLIKVMICIRMMKNMLMGTCFHHLCWDSCFLHAKCLIICANQIDSLCLSVFIYWFFGIQLRITCNQIENSYRYKLYVKLFVFIRVFFRTVRFVCFMIGLYSILRRLMTIFCIIFLQVFWLLIVFLSLYLVDYSKSD